MDPESEQTEFDDYEIRAAFGRRLSERRYLPRSEIVDMVRFLELFFVVLTKQLKNLLLVAQNAVGIVFWVSLSVIYAPLGHESDTFEVFLTSKKRKILGAQDITAELDILFEEMISRNANFIRAKSGLVLQRVMYGDILIARYNPLSGLGFIPLPKYLTLKKAIVNVQNTDNRCFGYAILSALLQPKNVPSRAAHYTQELFAQYNLGDIQYPVQINQIFELEPKLKVNINVFGFFDDEGRGRYPMYISRHAPFGKEIDLLYWSEHYAWIRNFNRFMGDIATNQHSKYWCKRCLCYFYLYTAYQFHQRYCEQNDEPKTVYALPPPATTISFVNERFKQRVPFVIYADFECLLSTEVPKRISHHRTKIYQTHVPCAVGLKVISDFPDVSFPYEQYRGPDPAAHLIDRLIKISTLCLQVLFNPVRLIMSEENKTNFRQAVLCHICGKTLGFDRVRDHDHITGEFRGAAHALCNLRMRSTYKIVVFFHNFRGYDGHLIVQKLNHYKDYKIKIIPQSMEKYLTVAFGEHIVFKDSAQFLQCPLAVLAQNIVKSGKGNLKNTFNEFKGITSEQENMLLRKGVFPYDYLDSWDRFAETQLPSIEKFYNMLSDSNITPDDYQFAKNVWSKFNCKNFGDYIDLYLKIDVLLLADIFETFRKVAGTHYVLDPAHFVSSPNLSWEAMLFKTKCKLELISDTEMFRMIDDGIRGGICNIVKRYARANNKYLPAQFYDPTKPSVYLIYLDANNLYGYAMSQPMPYDSFEWLGENDIAAIDWIKQERNQDHGYFVECDLLYPAHLHEMHNDYPLAAERLRTRFEYLSDTQMNLYHSYNLGRTVQQSKLIPNLMSKKHYVCHYLNLRFYLQHGLKLGRVHRVIKFRQAPWLAMYIDLNTRLRAQSQNDFEKDFFKLMNNSVYGKTCENQKGRHDIRLVTDDKKCKKLIEKPHCMGFRIFDTDLAAVHMRKIQVLINKPFYVGFSVLELSKLLMLEFHYEVMQPHYGHRLQLCFTDTDSLFYEIQTEDVYDDMWKIREWFDFAAYPKSNKFFDATNNKVIGKFKDEANGEPILEFVGLRPKMYSYIMASEDGHTKEKFRAKGIARAALKSVHHKDFLAQLNLPAENFLMNRRIGSKLHKIYSCAYGAFLFYVSILIQ